MDDFGILIGQYNATLPTLTDGQFREAQVDVNGRLIIAGRWLAGSDSYAVNDSGVSMLAVRNDAGGALSGVADGEYTPLQVDSLGRLVVNAQVTVDIGAEKAEDTAHVSGDTGNYVLSVRADTRPTGANVSADGDYASIFVNASGELWVKDADGLAKLTEIDTVLDNIKLDTANLVAATKLEDDAHSSGDRGNYVLAVRADTRPTGANGSADGDYVSFFVNASGELYVKDTDALAKLTEIDTVLDNIKLDTAAMVVDLAAIEVEQLAQGLTLDSILLDTTKIASSVYDEDSGHTTADPGQFMLGIRNDSNTVLTSADLDYSGIAVDSAGRLKIVGEVTFTKEGTEAYTVTDALAAAGDGLETITAAATPWVTVASLAVGAGVTAHLYGWQWACDQNAQARIVTDDTTDIIVYKTDINSSADPGKSEHFSSDGRIEIAGAASLEIKLQIKKRSTPGGNANGTGSMHIRTV